MIDKLKSQRFIIENVLRVDFGIPSYILDNYSENALVVLDQDLRVNPYSCYDKECGFTITLCNKVAEKIGYTNQTEKCKAYIQFSLDKVAEQGHCYAKEWQVNSHLKDQKFTDYCFQNAISELQKQRLVFVSPKGNYFSSKYFNAEMRFANKLKELSKLNNRHTGFIKSDFSSVYEKLNEIQKSVVDAIESNSLIVFTGLPGTGKTTTIRAIVDCYGEEDILLFAPTGKAAARMSELCSIQANTLHSVFSPLFIDRPVYENKIIIVDELSMCDVEIAGNLANGIGNGCVVILVGDPDQLPSVGPGQVLKDVLASGVGLRYHLNVVMRTKPGSILQSAHSIHAGKFIVTGEDKEVLTFYPKVWDIAIIVSQILKHPEWKDAQFLSVLREKGSTIANTVAQKILNPHGLNKFKTGDKVIHTKNNKDLGVFNGEMGIVVNSGFDGITVEFKDKLISYPHNLMWQLDLAYCITIHKSQGSEFDKVVLLLSPSQITTRNIFYTGLTRTKSKILIVAPSEEVIVNAIANKQKSRQTSMSWLLKKE